MSSDECCEGKLGSGEGCRCPSCDDDEDQDSVSSPCEIPTRGAQREEKEDPCCLMNLSVPDHCGKDKDGCCPCNMRTSELCGKDKDGCCPCNMSTSEQCGKDKDGCCPCNSTPEQCGKDKDGCCPCNMSTSEQCGKDKDGCCSCNMSTPEQCGKDKDGCCPCNMSTPEQCGKDKDGCCPCNMSTSEQCGKDKDGCCPCNLSTPEQCGKDKDGCCPCNLSTSEQCGKDKDKGSKYDNICCSAEEWSCTRNSSTTDKCGTGKQCASCYCKRCIKGGKPIHDESNKTNDCASQDKANVCVSRDKINDCALRDKANACVSRDKTNVCTSSCCRDKVCEKVCGSPTEGRCCGNGVRAPDCGKVKGVFCDPENPVIKHYKKICEARERIGSYTKKTPCERSEKLSEVLGLHLYFKKDFLQTTGSFKDRGTFNALLQLSEDQRERGVIAASAGNYALALAHVGSTLNIPVTVVLPTNAAIMKIKKCKDLNAQVVLCGQDFGEAERYAMQLGNERGLLYMNGYDHPDIIAGQGTMGCEIFEQLPHIDAIVVAVGGGGLIAGVSAALKKLKPDVEIYGVELETSTAFKAATEAGRPVKIKVTKSLFDGLSVPQVGDYAFKTASPNITELVTVKEDSIVTAMMQLLEKEKIVVEGAGAAGLAAIIEGKLPQLKGKTVVVVLCGANIDMSVLRHVIERGLTLEPKRMRFDVEFSDTPGALATLTDLVGDQGARLIASSTERGLENNDVFSGKVTCVVETRDSEHAKKFEEVIRSHYPTCHFCHE